ncbi:MAG: hypothetical protein Q4C46_09085 [Bacillota bacterium]|nr:hypothetical protein [Bacillota bacterium]
MYALCYILGMISVTVFIYAVIIRNRRNKKEAMTASASAFIVIAVLGIVKWLFM